MSTTPIQALGLLIRAIATNPFQTRPYKVSGFTAAQVAIDCPAIPGLSEVNRYERQIEPMEAGLAQPLKPLPTR